MTRVHAVNRFDLALAAWAYGDSDAVKVAASVLAKPTEHGDQNYFDPFCVACDFQLELSDVDVALRRFGVFAGLCAKCGGKPAPRSKIPCCANTDGNGPHYQACSRA